MLTLLSDDEKFKPKAKFTEAQTLIDNAVPTFNFQTDSVLAACKWCQDEAALDHVPEQYITNAVTAVKSVVRFIRNGESLRVRDWIPEFVETLCQRAVAAGSIADTSASTYSKKVNSVIIAYRGRCLDKNFNPVKHWEKAHKRAAKKAQQEAVAAQEAARVAQMQAAALASAAEARAEVVRVASQSPEPLELVPPSPTEVIVSIAATPEAPPMTPPAAPPPLPPAPETVLNLRLPKGLARRLSRLISESKDSDLIQAVFDQWVLPSAAE